MSEEKFGEWQPIETAPMDGTQILFWDGSRCRVAWFDADEGMWQDESCRVRFTYGLARWMPLPEPPEDVAR